MADYYSILKKTISGLGKNTPEIRNAVYAKARASIERQLRGIDPPISEEAIASQMLSLEQSIATIDAEYATATPPPAETPANPPQPAPTQQAGLSQQAPAASPPPPPPPAPEPQRVPEPTYTAPEPRQASNPAMDILSGNSQRQEPGQARGPESSVDPHSVQTTAGALDAMSSAVQADARRGPETASLAPEPDYDPSEHSFDDEPKRGGLGKIILVLVLLGLLGGGGYFAWQSQDQIMQFAQTMLGSGADSGDQDSGPEQDNSGNSSVDKEAVRIGEDGQDTSADPVDENATANEVTQVAPTPDPAVTAPAQEPETTEPVVQPVEEEAAADAEETPPAAVPQSGEVAYLYEEGSAGSGATRTNAGITWAVQQEQVQEGSEPEPVIVGTMEVPERGVTLNIKIKRNLDEALSASHLIEMVFDIPAGFSGQGIEEVARFVMKPTEEARGEALVAVPVKVSDGFFLVALDNLPQAVEVNTQLMESSAWIDIPVSYNTGKRALLTLEKGTTGEQAFSEALADWRNRQ